MLCFISIYVCHRGKIESTFILFHCWMHTKICFALHILHHNTHTKSPHSIHFRFLLHDSFCPYSLCKNIQHNPPALFSFLHLSKTPRTIHALQQCHTLTLSVPTGPSLLWSMHIIIRHRLLLGMTSTINFSRGWHGLSLVV